VNRKALLQVVVPVLSSDLRFSQTFEYLLALKKFKKIQITVITDSIKKIEEIISLQGVDSKKLELIQVPKKGVYNAMNSGVMLGNSKYHIFLNCGDIPILDSYDAVLKVLELEDRHVCCSFFTSASVTEKVMFNKNPGWGEKHSPHQAYIFNNSRLKGRPYDESYAICSDYCYIKELKGGDIVFLDIPVVLYDLESGLSKERPFRAIWETFLIEKNLGTPIYKNIYFFIIKCLKNILIAPIKSIGALNQAIKIKKYIIGLYKY